MVLEIYILQVFCKHCRLCPVTMTGPRSCSELSNSKVKAWEGSLPNCNEALAVSRTVWSWSWFVSVEFDTRSCLCFKILSWDQRKTSVFLLWVMSSCLVINSVLQSPVFHGAPHWICIVLNSNIPFWDNQTKKGKKNWNIKPSTWDAPRPDQFAKDAGQEMCFFGISHYGSKR